MTKYRWNAEKGKWEEDVLVSNTAFVKGIFYLIIIALVYGCYDATIGRSIDIHDVEKYCAAEQLLKTGQAKCVEVKRKLSQRYINELKNNEVELSKLDAQTWKLKQNKLEKCSSSGLSEYGTEGCSAATNDLTTNNRNIDKLTKEINQKQQEITNMQIFKLYRVNASSLNVRKCEATTCEVVAQILDGEEIYAESDDSEWVLIEGGRGYAMKKYLTPISNSKIKVDLENQLSNEKEIRLTNIVKKSDTTINSSTSVQPKTTDFREVNWANASYQDIINMINAGANINQIYEAGTTVLMLAVDMGANSLAIKALIDKGADVKAKNENEYTALHFSAYQNNQQLIEILVKNGANINATDSSGITPLMLAAKDNNNPEIITTLIKSGADVNKRSMIDMTAIDYAAYGNKNLKILETLLQQGAIADENTLNWAQENENPNISIFLKKHLEEKAKSSKKIFGLPIF